MLSRRTGLGVMIEVILVFALVDVSSGQQSQGQPAPEQLPQQIEARSQPSVDAMREIVRAIRQCPPTVDFETKWGKGPLEIDRWYIGSPKNVVWDVAPSRTVRSPYVGYIEFSASHYLWIPLETQAKFDRAYPGLRTEAAIKGKDWKFRYEFDVGPAGVELTRALSLSADEKEWSEPSKRDVCWDNAARKGWTAVERK